jgi:hypothetical protein
MTFIFRKAVREDVGLIIGLIGPSGGGKTYTAMRLASGMANGAKFCVIDTEAGRAKHYADQFKFDHGDLKPPFRPAAYADAIHAADAQGYKVIVVDSMSHEWAGEGGILDWQDEELTRMAGDNWQRREACKMAAWIKPKMQHKQMAQRLLQVRAHLILCFRAEEKVEMVKGDDNKTKIVPKGWVPICEKNLPYELTLSMLLTPDAPGVPKPIKLQEQHRALFPAGQPITEDTGRRIAAWAGRAATEQPAAQPPAPTPEQPPGDDAPVQTPTDAIGYSFFHPGRDDAVDTLDTPEAWFAAFEEAIGMVMSSRKLRPDTKQRKANDLKTANERVLRRMGATAIVRAGSFVNKFSSQLDAERKAAAEAAK